MSKRKANNSWWAQNAKRVKRDSLIGGNSEGAGYIISFDTSKKRDAVRQCYSLFNEYVEKLNFGTTKKEEIEEEEEEEEIEDIEAAINKQAAQLKEKQDFKFTSIDIGVRGMSFISCDLVALGIKDAPENDTTKSESENQIESNPVETDQKAETNDNATDTLTKDDSNSNSNSNNNKQQENISNNNPTEPSKIELTEQQKACIDFPVSFLRSIFTDLAKEGKQKTKHIHRVIPLQLLCRANEEEILKNVSSLVEIYFGSVRKIDDNDDENNNKESDTIKDNDSSTNSSKAEATKNGDTNPSKIATEESSNIEEAVSSNDNETQTEDTKETKKNENKPSSKEADTSQQEQAPTLSKRELAKQRPIRKNAFSIHYKCRNNNKIKKDTIRKKIFSLVPKEFIVDLYKPNNVIIVEIFQTVCGISVIMDYPELYDLRIRNATKLKE